ncbi:DUF4292 domain-containing protein [Parabacteroides chongii]|uniref:DUF4292 domain-containing protein n=1 Tax=Parabacteroides chongii TaxID=2685834 RepID=UPI00240E3D62|nr:DUF4292 domain-containing protein [Parabacteroides chongii]WFE85879.1 DUF4292 domain-containing protein [Parabacteroides chongii]
MRIPFLTRVQLPALIVVCFLLVLSGCKSSKKVGTVVSGGAKAHNEFFEAMEEHSFQFNTMTARLNAELKGTKNNMSSRVDLKMVKDSAFQLSVQPFLGIEVFRAEFTVDSIKVVDRMNKRYVAERYADLKGQTPIEFNFYNLQALFTNHIFLPGQQFIEPKQFKRFKLNQEGSTAEIRIKDSLGLLYTFFADGEEKLLSTYITDPSEQYALQWDYADFRITDGQPFPQLMDVNVLANGSSQGGIAFRFSRIQTNVPVNLEFSIPAKYKRITFAQILKSISNSQK